jgi:hypothetical protein
VVVSIAGSTTPQESSRFDILSKDKQEVAQMLHMHLDKDCFGEGDEEDDLMSWTSSLPNAIQYAVWRAHIGKRHPSQISICAIDTSKFHLGQFVRDISLIEAYREAAAQLTGSTSRFFDFRLNTSDYYDGENLFQGAVKHYNSLWPKGSGTWDSSRLTRVIAREARLYLDTTLGILLSLYPANTCRVAVSSEIMALTRNSLTNKRLIVHGSLAQYTREVYKRPQVM